jgi:hypothetical protein
MPLDPRKCSGQVKVGIRPKIALPIDPVGKHSKLAGIEHAPPETSIHTEDQGHALIVRRGWARLTDAS